ncbi:hypothetical protein Taro_002060 [Colocasia esculenta]|uniref:Uncharacterized protein n=1 Tax=Colocasia esculenta TaxID=4460 RepID=A0A843TG95_COLES|nr:hypothetical protein [Colocasia esculenta]
MKFKPQYQAFNKPRFEATSTESKESMLSTLSELHKLSQDFHYSEESKEQKLGGMKFLALDFLQKNLNV